MGTIRDEIEKLRSYKLLIYLKDEHDEKRFLVKQEVLSILDEWELVAEITGEDWLCPPADDPCDDLPIEPRDHIAIYVRRGKEDE